MTTTLEAINPPDAKRKTWEIYSNAWANTAPTERLALFAECLHPACVYTDPLIQTTGFAELAEYMDECHRRFPGLLFLLTDFLTHHNHSISHWTMIGGDGQALIPGVSFGLYHANGKLVQMTGFFEA